jgi:hypothetical protein
MLDWCSAGYSHIESNHLLSRILSRTTVMTFVNILFLCESVEQSTDRPLINAA